MKNFWRENPARPAKLMTWHRKSGSSLVETTSANRIAVFRTWVFFGKAYSIYFPRNRNRNKENSPPKVRPKCTRTTAVCPPLILDVYVKVHKGPSTSQKGKKPTTVEPCQENSRNWSIRMHDFLSRFCLTKKDFMLPCVFNK